MIKINPIPEKELTGLQQTHLQAARAIAEGVSVVPANITNSVKIIGAFDTWSEIIYVAPERLSRLSTTVNTTIHELAHQRSKADDHTEAHSRAIEKVSAQVAAKAQEGRYDKYLIGVVW